MTELSIRPEEIRDALQRFVSDYQPDQASRDEVGTVAEAGVETETEDGAEVLVAVTVRTSNAGAAEQEPRAWRMLISVQRVGDEAKVSNVRFVS